MDSKNFFDNFETIANAPGGIAHLRGLIRDLAVRGKLVERSIEDVWGEEIQLRDVGKMIRGVTYAKAESSKSGGAGLIPLLGAANIQSEINFDGLTYVPENLIKPDQIVRDGDVLICMSSGSKHLVGKTGSISIPPRASFGAFCAVFRIVNPAHHEYIAMFFKSPVYRNAISAVSRGIGINNLRVGDVESISFVLPSIDEQTRIVAKVDELMGLLDELESAQIQRDSIRASARRSAIDSISTATTPAELNAAWKRICDNWLNFADTPESISSLRSLILGLAVRGKLVPQIANEKLLEAVTVNGKFELPNSWRWVKISTVTEFVNGFAFKSEEYSEDGIGIVRMSDLKLGQIAVQGMKRVPEKYRTILDENLRVSPGDLVIGMSGSIGKPCFNLTDKTFLLNQRVGKFVPHSVDKSYLAIVLQTLENSFLEMSAGSGIKNLSTKQIKDAELPLPPALEQKRIVSNVAQLMTLCDQLEHSLIKRDEIAKKIAGSLASEIAA
jgi:type I restriction enzyme, S subunit